MSLFTRHPLLLQTAYSEFKRRALEQDVLLVGTAGSVGEREVKGRAFLYRQFYDAEGSKSAEYLGPADDAGARTRAAALRGAIDLTNALVKEARILGQHGYARVDGRARSVLAALASHGLFRAGAVLVGSHAFGALLNESGVNAGRYLTEDVDVARARTLALGPDADFEQMLAESTVALVPVPPLDRAKPATSFKAPGASRFRVDLLTAARGERVEVRAVPELGAHATALPHLQYLLAEPVDTVVLGRDGVVPVRVPRPEAFAWHKVLVSQLRGETREKRAKDVAQAAVLFAVLGEDAPDAVAEAFARLPRKTRTRVRAGARRVLDALRAAGHERGERVVAEVL